MAAVPVRKAAEKRSSQGRCQNWTVYKHEGRLHMEVRPASWRADYGGGSAEMRLTIANG